MTAVRRGVTEMNFAKLSIYALVVLSMATPTSVLAWHWWDDDDEEEVKIPLEEAELFFELNDTDGDLGIHGFADGDAWKELEIEAPNGREFMEIDVKSKLKRQGVTELFFESAEPCFPPEEFGEEAECDDPLAPAKFFKRFPQGTYEIEVELLDGDELESEVYLSHKIPAAPVVDSVGTAADPTEEGECWGLISGGAVDVLVEWIPVTLSHADLGTPNSASLEDNKVINYEFVAEIDGTYLESSTIVSPGTTEWTIPGEFIALALGVEVEDDEGGEKLVDEIKFEILVRVDNGEGNPGNKSAVESCFETDINEED